MGTSTWTADIAISSVNTSHAIHGLKSSTQYEVQIRAVNGTDSNDKTNSTNWSSTVTSDSIGIPEVAEFDITATNATQNSLALKWNTLSIWNDNNANTNSRGFELEWRPEGDAYWSGNKLDVGINLTSVGKGKFRYGYSNGSEYVGDTIDSNVNANKIPSELFAGNNPGDQTVTEISNYYLEADFYDPIGVCSDSTTMGVISEADNAKIYAYDVKTGAKDTSKDITLNSNNTDPKDIYTDGETIWVVDLTDKKLYAYTIATGAYSSGSDFNTLDAAGNDNPISVWADGIIMYVFRYH